MELPTGTTVTQSTSQTRIGCQVVRATRSCARLACSRGAFLMGDGGSVH